MVARRDIAHLDRRRPVGEEEEVVVVICVVGTRHPLEMQLGVAVHADDVSVGEHGLCARPGSGDEAVAGENRHVGPGRGVVLGAGDEENIGLNVRQVRVPFPLGFGTVRRDRRGEKQGGGEGGCRQPGGRHVGPPGMLCDLRTTGSRASRPPGDA